MIVKYNGLDCVSSLTIAKEFNKNHHKVLRDIRNIIGKCGKEGLFNLDQSSYFIESIYLDEYGRSQSQHFLTKNGLFLYLFRSDIKVGLHLMKTLDISNIFEAIDDYSPIKIKEPYYLYLLQSGNSNVYKIGIAKDVDARINQITHHDVLKLVKYWEFESKEDCSKVEKAVHKALQEYRANREWFYLSEDSDKSIEIVDNLIKS